MDVMRNESTNDKFNSIHNKKRVWRRKKIAGIQCRPLEEVAIHTRANTQTHTQTLEKKKKKKREER